MVLSCGLHSQGLRVGACAAIACGAACTVITHGAACAVIARGGVSGEGLELKVPMKRNLVFRFFQ